MNNATKLKGASLAAFLAVVHGSLSQAALAQQRSDEVRLEAMARGGFVCKTSAYEAIVGKDGNLRRLRVGETDMLAPDDGAVPSAGFVHAGQFVALESVRQEKPDTLVADGRARITYRFQPDRIELTLRQSLDTYGAFAWVPSASVVASHDALTDCTIRPQGPFLYGQTDPRWTTKEGPILRFDFGVWQRGFANASWGTANVGGKAVHYLAATVPASGPIKVTAYPMPRPSPRDALTFAITADDPDFILPGGKPVHFDIQAANAGPTPVEARVVFEVRDYLTQKPVGTRATEVKLAARAEMPLPTDLAVEKSGPYRAAIVIEEGGKAVRSFWWVFTYDFEHYAPPTTRQPDFEQFWKDALAGSAALPLDIKMTRVAEKSTPAVDAFRISYATLGGRRIYGWYARPTKPGKYPAHIRYPSSGIYPLPGPEMNPDRCSLWIAIHGFDVDLSNMPAGDDPGKNYWTAGIRSPRTSMWRTIYVSLVRAVDFMLAQPEVDPKRVAVVGGSQGGGLAMAAAALDHRIGFCVPAYSGLPRLDWTVAHEPGYWPFGMAAKPQGQSDEEFLKTLSYFDTANFTQDIRCPVAAEVGLMDTVTASGNQICALAHVPRGLLYMACSPWGGHGSGSRPGNRCGELYARFLKGQPAMEKPNTPAKKETVRDRLWLWGHHAGAHNRQYGLKQDSAITPAAAAKYMGIRNILMVRYGNVPAPPFDDYARPVAGLDRVVWSVEGGGGDDVGAALGLRKALPNLRGLMMDDYFQRVRPAAAPLPRMWLAKNEVKFPVTLTLSFAKAIAPDKVELTQSAWRTGDYLSKDFALDLSPDGAAWQEAARGVLPARGGASVSLKLPGSAAKAMRVRILSTHDTKLALSCGLRRVRLWVGEREVPSNEIKAEATSEYPGHPAENVLSDAVAEHPFSLDALKRLRRRLDAAAPPLELWVVLYTHEFGMPILKEHLDLCDVVTMWTWKASDLALLDKNMARFEEIVGKKRKVLGLYMYDYGTGKPVPVDIMKQQCETGLRWLREERIEGMIFLASCICDLPLEAMEWSRRWIAKVGDESLHGQR